jgi:hypothetical protein
MVQVPTLVLPVSFTKIRWQPIETGFLVVDSAAVFDPDCGPYKGSGVPWSVDFQEAEIQPTGFSIDPEIRGCVA